MATPKPVLGFIGLGTMGLPMSANLAAAGYQVHGFDLSESALTAASRQGVTVADSAAAVGAAADIVFTCLPSQAILEQTVRALIDSLSKGAVIVDHSTVSSELEKRLAAQAAARGIGFLDAPLSGAGIGAKQATLTIMVGGEHAQFERCKPLFEVTGKHVFHLGGVGNGQCLKLCQNLIFLSTLTGIMESVALGRAVGVEPKQLIEVMDTCLAPTRVMEVIVKPKLDGRVPFDHTSDGLTMLTKDITLVRELAERLNLGLPVMEQVQGLFKQAVDKGFGKRDLVSWYELVEQGVFD